MKKGPQTNDMSTTEALSILAVRVSVLDEKVDLKRQLLFRKAGKTISEKDVRWKEDGNNPVTVIDACPEYERELGAIRRDTGEKSKTDT
jgi:hypothetical protein